MSQPILVRGIELTGWRHWKNLCRLAGFVLLAVGVGSYFMVNIRSLSVLFTALATLLLIVVQVHSLRNLARRRWVSDTHNGFTVVDRAGQRDYQDD